MKIAIFGGTFDPVHKAHIAIAHAALERFGLDKVLVVPAAQPPHKQGRQTEEWADRYRMVQLACAADPRLEASDLEASHGKSYSIHTIEAVRNRLRPEDELYFIIGADAFAEITTWFRWRDVVASTQFIVVTRPGHTYAIPPGAVVHSLDTLNMPVSSSDIREKLARCELPAELPEKIFEYIRAERLYGYGSACPEATRPVSD